MLKSWRHLFQSCQLYRILGTRSFAGLNPTSKSIAKHADWAEFHRPRKFVAAARAGALEVRAHFTTRLSVAIRNEKNTVRTPSRGNSGPKATGILLSCCTGNRVLRYISVLYHIPEKIPFASLLRREALTMSFRDAAL